MIDKEIESEMFVPEEDNHFGYCIEVQPYPMVLYLHFTRKSKAMQPSKDNESNRVDTYLSLLTTINKGIEDLLGPASKGLEWMRVNVSL